LNELIYASAVIAAASFAQSVSGVGFVMVATPFLLSIMNVKDAVVVGCSMAIISQLLVIFSHWRKVHPQMFLNFVLGSAAGAPVGIWFFSATSLTSLKSIVGVVLVGISAFSLQRIYKTWRVMDTTTAYRLSAESPPRWSPGELARCCAGRAGKVQMAIGVVAGFFGASIGMPGIPLTAYYSAVNVDKEVARSTTLLFFIVLLSATLAANYLAGSVSATASELAPLLVPSVVVGMLLGNRAFPYLPQRWFQLILNLTILYSACRILSELFLPAVR
jgi:uncharacterized membrane protein YfcA